jgi:cytochrome c oxidase cbb3-type subunit 3
MLGKGAVAIKLFGRIILILLTVWALPAWSSLDGKKLYRDHCMVCHGEHGGGGVGVPLALPSFLDNVDNAFLFKTIRNGRPGRVMPTFDYLSDAQINALVTYIRGWGDGPAPVFSTTPVKGDPLRGKALFEQKCAACHGKTGEGGRGTGVTFSRPRDLPIIAPALNNEGFLAAASDELIRHTLMVGRKGTPMVSFLDAGLSEQQIDDIVSYVRSFEQAEHREPVLEAESASLIMESPYSLEETVENVKQVIIGKNFRLIREQYLDTGFVPKGEENKKQVVIYFCNFSFLNKALNIDPRVGLFLPCRITVVEQDGVVKVMAINPMRLSRIFNNVELNEACHQMRDVYNAILEEATL